METEIIIRMGDKENKNGLPRWKIRGLVQKATVLTGSYAPSIEDATDMFVKAYKEALSDLTHYAPSKVSITH